MSSFIPDVVIDADNELSRSFNVYLNGELLSYCYQVRVKLASFKEPTFGEVIVRSPRGTLCALDFPRLSEFEWQGTWAQLQCGKVLITISSEARDDFVRLWRLSYPSLTSPI